MKTKSEAKKKARARRGDNVLVTDECIRLSAAVMDALRAGGVVHAPNTEDPLDRGCEVLILPKYASDVILRKIRG